MTHDSQGHYQWRAGMIGGGAESFIGPVHRMAMGLDGRVVLMAGAFSSDPSRSAATGVQLAIAPDRVHSDYKALLADEAKRADGERIDFVSIVTPNHLHAPLAIAALEAGFPVFCEKPMATSLPEARAIAAKAREAGLPVGMAYTYLGYPLVHEARRLIAEGMIGRVRRIAVSYTQGWLAEPIEQTGDTQADWRTDPARSGPSGALADIGVHAQSLSDFIAGDPIAEVAADLRATLDGRRIDDDAAMLFRTLGGIPGTLIASQVCGGDENRLGIVVHGEKGTLRWEQEQPNRLEVAHQSGGTTIITPNDKLRDAGARTLLRLPGGHPEGLIEALANLYRAFVMGLDTARPTDVPALHLPSAEDGIRSLAFIEAALASSAANGRWQALAPLL